MSGLEIGIIGGTGGMGRWFADFLQGLGYTVHVSGRTAGMTPAEMAGRCQVVVVSVPISKTCDTIVQVGPLLGKEQLLMDLTSVKVEPVQSMMKFSVSEVIGCHPLFGPQVVSMEQQHVVLCPVRTKKWFPWLLDILEKGKALVIETTPEKHDEVMSVVQGLNHLNTIMMGMALSKIAAPLSQLDPFMTPLFSIKTKIVEKILTDGPRLYAEILCTNQNMKHMIEIYERMLGEIKSHIAQDDVDGLIEMMQKATNSLWPPDN